MTHRTKSRPIISVIIALVSFVCVFVFVTSRYEPRPMEAEQKEEGEAFEVFQWWYGQRANSDGFIPRQGLAQAHRYASRSLKKETPKRTVNGLLTQWESIGPANVAGRILSIAVDPLDPNILWAGSASGGLWKSTTKGAGVNAWSYVNTGYPTIAVSCVTIDQSNPTIMYIGTGEISYYQYPLVGTPGARASYGMGILKSTDAGNSWSQTSLTFAFSDITAIQEIVINPLNPTTLYTAASEGVYKSTDAGGTWSRILSVVMAMDIVISPADTNIIVSVHGNLNSSPNQGMYRSTNAGDTWTQVTDGLPAFNFGRTSLAISPSNPQTLFAGISNGSSRTMIGLYQSTNSGESWAQMSTTNYVGTQGWFNNIVAVHPEDENIVYCGGLNLYKSTTGGSNLAAKSNWAVGYTQSVATGGPEGPPSYIHADHHAMAFDPTDPNILYVGSDGGVFQSTDGGETFAGRNGGLITAQFFGGFANSSLSEHIAFGGLQDNGVLKYTGTAAWRKVDGGDGGWCAIDPRNDNIVYDEYVYLAMSKSTNGGFTFQGLSGGLPSGSNNANFIAPFVIAHSSPDILYAGAKNVYKSTNGGVTWLPTNGGAFFNGTPISCIGISWTSADTLMAATGTGTYQSSPSFEVFVTKNGGASWSNVTGSLPARYPSDIYFDPSNSRTAYISYSGYGSSHVFKTTNLGQAWIDITANLPDVPVQSIANDPEEPENIFAGTDLGVYHSSNGGASWNDFNAGMPIAMITDLTTYNPAGLLRAATFGNGVYQRTLPRVPQFSLAAPAGNVILIGGKNYAIRWNQKYCTTLTIEYSPDAGITWDTIATNIPAIAGSYQWNVPMDSTRQGKLRVTHDADNSLLDTSDSLFSVMLNPDVLEGWNLLSLHLAVPDPRKEELFPTSASSAFLFDKGYETRDSMLNGPGYWIKFDAPQHITISGDSLFSDTVDVTARWNIIGSISTPISIDQISEITPAFISAPIFGFDDGYYVTDSIRPMRGYWVKMSQQGQIVLSTNPAMTKRRTKVSDILHSLSTLVFENHNGKSQTLFLGDKRLTEQEHSFTAQEFELPPLPPAGVFDVRFASNRLIEYIPDELSGETSLSVRLSSAEFPVHIRFENKQNMSASLVLINGEEQIPFSSTASITSPASVVAIRFMQGKEQPTGFTLEQNYPNPFNPVTNFSFRIEERGLTSLKIYDMLGREIATLLDEMQEAGTKRIQWDATALPSGIYFYKLESGKQQITKKMILLK